MGDPEVPAGESRLRHVRVGAADLGRSVPWYDGLGFELIDRTKIDDAASFGHEGPVDAEVARLRLPDEPFEALLVQWNDPAGHGAHPTEANHAGLYGVPFELVQRPRSAFR